MVNVAAEALAANQHLSKCMLYDKNQQRSGGLQCKGGSSCDQQGRRCHGLTEIFFQKSQYINIVNRTDGKNSGNHQETTRINQLYIQIVTNI